MNIPRDCNFDLAIAFIYQVAYAEYLAAAPEQAFKRPKTLTATPPVNPTQHCQRRTLPKWVFYTALNPTFANKDRSQDGSRPTNTFSQAWLLKLRYGITNSLELNFSYVNLTRTDPEPAVKHLEGYGDQLLGLSYALHNIHQGDPFALSFSVGALLSTAPEGDNHLRLVIRLGVGAPPSISASFWLQTSNSIQVWWAVACLSAAIRMSDAASNVSGTCKSAISSKPSTSPLRARWSIPRSVTKARRPVIST